MRRKKWAKWVKGERIVSKDETVFVIEVEVRWDDLFQGVERLRDIEGAW